MMVEVRESGREAVDCCGKSLYNLRVTAFLRVRPPCKVRLGS